MANPVLPEHAIQPSPDGALNTLAASEPFVVSAQKSELLVDLFENTSDLIQLISIDGRIELVNPAWCQALGYSEAEAIGMNVFQLIAPDCQEHCQLLFQELLSQASRRRIQCAFLARCGRRIELEGQLDVGLENGTPARVRGILRDVSERRAAELALQALNDSLEQRIRESTAALRSSEARLEEAQAVAHVGHWDLDLVSGAVHWSEEICRLYGFDQDGVTPSYERFLDRVHPEDRPLVEAVHQRMQELRQPLELHYRLALGNGELRHVQSRVVTHRDGDDRPVRVIGTSQDVTRLVQSQRQLLDSEQKLRSLFELSPLGIALISSGGHCIRTNRAFDQLFKAPGHNGSGIFVHPDTTNELERMRRAALSSGDATISFEQSLSRADGQALPLRLRAQRLRAASARETARVEGEDSGEGDDLVWLMVEDRSQQLATEQSMRQAANVFRYAQDGVLITETDGRIVDVNEAFSRITGYSRQEVLGATPNLLKSGVHDMAFYGRMWKELKREGSWSGEVTNRARDGSLQEMLETISSVKDEQGKVTHYVALLTDIRQIKAQQHQLERLAHYDALTGLPNRILLAQRLQRAMDDSRTSGHPIAICYLDLDGFKEINDSLGHAAGDHLLQVVAVRMDAVLPPGDVLARLGGDEFVLVLGDGQRSDATQPLLEAILTSLLEPVDWQGEAMRVTASIGVTHYSGSSAGLGPDQLLRHADNAMYHAKRLGKNRYAFHPGDPL